MKTFFSFLLALMSLSVSAQNLKSVSYADGPQKLTGMVTSNAGKKLPGVLILPAWKGIDDEAKEAAQALNKEGYIAFIADIYGEGNVPKDNAEAAAIAGKFKSDYALYQQRISLALEQLQKAGAEKIAIIGYCFGGQGALEAARAQMPVQGVVSIHGGLGKDAARPNGAIPTKVLIEHPAEDKTVTPEQLQKLQQELNEGKADWQLITYAYCGHTFTNPQTPDYNPVMAKRAWQHTMLFLREVLSRD